MNPSESRLPIALEAAVNQVKATAQAVAERVASGLAMQAQSATRIIERDMLLTAQIDLRRGMNTFLLAFGKALLEKVHDEMVPRHDARRAPVATDWQSLSLVDDQEVEQRMFATRIGQQITHSCEWEMRDVAAYMGTVLNLGGADEGRNPLRAEVLGHALSHAIEAVTQDRDSRKLLAREFGHAMASALPACFAAIVRDMQMRNIRPVSLALKTVASHGGHTGFSSVHDELPSTRTAAGDFESSRGHAGPTTYRGGYDRSRSGASTQQGPMSTQQGAFGNTQQGHGPGHASTRGGHGPGGAPTTMGGGSAQAQRAAAGVSAEADAQLMALLRRLTFLASRPSPLDTQSPGLGGGSLHTGAGGLHGAIGALAADPGSVAAGPGDPLTGLMAVNLIRAHREELMQASSGKLDHMVIDVVGSLFDQILSDPKVPPQMARQIARLQLPVLRVALVDSTFFSSRRHPVRRFVNRIASLGVAFDEFDDGPGKEFLDRVKRLVQEIVEGDFDQLDLYSAKLTELERFISDQTEQTAQSSGAATVLESKESELRIQQRYMMQLSSALGAIKMPEYLRGFASQVWSQALVHAIRRQGPDSELARRFRDVGRDLVMSVQPKGSPALRKRFLVQLPTLMKDLNEGLRLVGWPEAAQKAFFAQLLPSHADSLKAAPMTELEHNLLAKQLEGIFATPVPGAHELSSAEPVSFDSAAIEQRFSPAEARQVGLVEESAVDWSGPIDIDLSADAADTRPDDGNTVPGDTTDTAPADLGIDINLDLVANDPAEPSHGPRLMDALRVGFAYQMLLKDQWQKVRLNYISPARSFFVFTRGRKHQETISLTSRMLARMCESNRLRAVEHAYLMERATARARRQLAALKASPTKH